MNGNNLLIDTNIAIYLLQGDKTVAGILNKRSIYVSEITELELLGYPDITSSDITIIKAFLNDCTIIQMNRKIKDITISLRQTYKINLPDAIIASTSIVFNLPFISADKGFLKLKEIQFINYEKE